MSCFCIQLSIKMNSIIKHLPVLWKINPCLQMYEHAVSYSFSSHWTWYDCRIEFSDPVAVRHALSIISEIAAKDPYSVAMALGQFTVYSHTANNCSRCLFYFDMYKEHMPLWFRILLIFRALKIVNTNKPNVTLDFSCDPDFFFHI